MHKDLTMKFAPPKLSIFEDCEILVIVKSIIHDRYDLEMHLMRHTAQAVLSLRIKEETRLSASMVDAALDSFTKKLTIKGWRLKT